MKAQKIIRKVEIQLNRLALFIGKCFLGGLIIAIEIELLLLIFGK